MRTYVVLFAVGFLGMGCQGSSGPTMDLANPGEDLRDADGIKDGVIQDADDQSERDFSLTDTVPPDLLDPFDTLTELDACLPACDGKECGDDGCGEICGKCTDGKACQLGKCVCKANDYKACCDQAVCWFDSCGTKGDKVADCQYGCKVEYETAVCESCIPNCSGKQCGEDGCGKDCGLCPAGACDGLVWVQPKTCEAGVCVGTGVLACDDGMGCTTDTCDPDVGCTNVLQSAHCMIAGGCYASGTMNGKCLQCMPLASATSWTYVTAKPCDDGNSCTSQDQCVLGGAGDAGCKGTDYLCDDQLECTTDVCDGLGGCTNTLLSGQCLIGGICYGDAQANAGESCQVCNTTKSTSVWSNAIDGTTCGTGGGCVSGTCCNANDHKACSGGSVYWYDSCGNVGSLAQTCQYGCTAGVCDPSSGCPLGYVLVPSGTFTMGSPTTEPGRYTDETEHQVTISKSFCLKATEVTQGEWQALMGNNPSYFSTCGSDCPVEQVSWWDSVAYCNKLSSGQGLTQCYTLTGCTGTPGVSGYTCTGVTFAGLTCTGYRLPTESEWEYAARAGTTTGTYNGTSTLIGSEQPNVILDPIAWFYGNSGSKTHAAKGKTPNAWGLYDMLGNVWEWTGDWYLATYPGTVTDPTGAPTGSLRVVRGGSWYFDARNAQAAYRDDDDPGYRYDNLGLRPARLIEP